MAHGVWERQRVVFFDNRILDTDAPSRFNCNMSYVTAMRTAVQEKKKKYQERCEDLAGSFTPFLVCTVDGVFHREFVAFMKRVAAVCTDPGCGPEITWVEEGVSWFRYDGRGWYGSGVLGVRTREGTIFVYYCVCLLHVCWVRE